MHKKNILFSVIFTFGSVYYTTPAPSYFPDILRFHRDNVPEARITETHMSALAFLYHCPELLRDQIPRQQEYDLANPAGSRITEVGDRRTSHLTINTFPGLPTSRTSREIPPIWQEDNSHFFRILLTHLTLQEQCPNLYTTNSPQELLESEAVALNQVWKVTTSVERKHDSLSLFGAFKSWFTGEAPASRKSSLYYSINFERDIEKEAALKDQNG